MKSITDILFKQQLEAPTSFEEVVVESSEMITSKKKKKIFKYLLGDSAKKSIYQIGSEKYLVISVHRCSDWFVQSNEGTEIRTSNFSLLKEKIKSDQQFGKKL